MADCDFSDFQIFSVDNCNVAQHFFLEFYAEYDEIFVFWLSEKWA
jgi:hypothetical protein